MEDGKKPALTQMGPFTYREETERVEEIFHDNGTVSYKTRKFWYFIEEESLDLDTMICTIDIPVVAGAEYARGSWFNEMSMEAAFDFAFKESVFINKTARQLLFDGYERMVTLTYRTTSLIGFTKETGPHGVMGWSIWPLVQLILQMWGI